MKNLKTLTKDGNGLYLKNGQCVCYYDDIHEKIMVLSRFFKRARLQALETFNCNFFVII